MSLDERRRREQSVVFGVSCGAMHKSHPCNLKQFYDAARNSVSMTTLLTVQPSFHLRSFKLTFWAEHTSCFFPSIPKFSSVMSKVHPSSSSLGGTDGEKREQPIPTVNKQPWMPEDGYEWNKYGQKYIKNIGGIRSYYRCRRRECKARKRLEWAPANPTILRVVYDGMHDHRPPSDVEQVHSADVNQYELRNQVLGQLNDPQQV